MAPEFVTSFNPSFRAAISRMSSRSSIRLLAMGASVNNEIDEVMLGRANARVRCDREPATARREVRPANLDPWGIAGVARANARAWGDAFGVLLGPEALEGGQRGEAARASRQGRTARGGGTC
jgi:hypothetical protein